MHHNLILIAPSAFSCTDFLDTTPSFLDHQHIDFEHQQFSDRQKSDIYASAVHRYRKNATSWPDSLFRFP
jgi:hypothetical protein